MEEPTSFLGLPLTPYLPNRWRCGTSDRLIQVDIYRQLDVQWLGGDSNPEWFTVFVVVSGIGSEEAQGPELRDVEAYFRKWISAFQKASASMAQTWPEEA